MKATRNYIVETAVCGTCAHYRQHYVLTAGGQFHALWYGHCCTPRTGRRCQPDEVCPHWQGQKEEPVSSR